MFSFSWPSFQKQFGVPVTIKVVAKLLFEHSNLSKQFGLCPLQKHISYANDSYDYTKQNFKP